MEKLEQDEDGSCKVKAMMQHEMNEGSDSVMVLVRGGNP